MSRAKIFPYQHQAKVPLLFYPEKLNSFDFDVLEIGPGHGETLLYLAKKYPQKKFLALELSKNRYHHLIFSLQKQNIKNVTLICGDARIILANQAKPETFDQILILFPDPWPKKRQAFRRLLQFEFLMLVASFLKPDGQLVIASDVKTYIQSVKKLLDEIPCLKNQLAPNPWVSSFEGLVPTYFSQKWQKDGRELYFMCYQRLAIKIFK